MLILKRREGESLTIGEQIEITILSVEPNGRVNIGISAPKDVLILRSELQQAPRANQDAAATPPQLIQSLEQVFSLDS